MSQSDTDTSSRIAATPSPSFSSTFKQIEAPSKPNFIHEAASEHPQFLLEALNRGLNMIENKDLTISESWDPIIHVLLPQISKHFP